MTPVFARSGRDVAKKTKGRKTVEFRSQATVRHTDLTNPTTHSLRTPSRSRDHR